MKVVSAAIALFALFNVFYRYFIFTKVWGYIAVPMFHVATITMWQAFALSCLVEIIHFNYMKPNLYDNLLLNKETLEKVVMGTAMLTVIWGLNWLCFA